MMAYFSIKGLNSEAFICTLVFIFSIFYIVLSYINVNDIDGNDKECREWLADLRQNDTQFQTVMNNWR